jgi:hypothetical protein
VKSLATISRGGAGKEQQGSRHKILRDAIPMVPTNMPQMWKQNDQRRTIVNRLEKTMRAKDKSARFYIRIREAS